MTGRMHEQIEDILSNERPDSVFVYGDANSNLAGTLAASKLHIAFAHVEVGLCYFNRTIHAVNMIEKAHLYLSMVMATNKKILLESC